MSPLFTLANRWTEGVCRKWLNLHNLHGDGTFLAVLMDDVRGSSDAISQHQCGGQMKSILDPSFRYTKSVETDLKKTFARIRRELRNQQQRQPMVGVEEIRKVFPIHSR